MVAFLRDRRRRIEAALYLTMAGSMAYLVMYSLVWEYHYTALLPVLGLLLVGKNWNAVEKTMLALGALVCGPSLYFLVSRTISLALGAERHSSGSCCSGDGHLLHPCRHGCRSGMEAVGRSDPGPRNRTYFI